MNKRDLELLSAHLDGELSPAESEQLEARIAADPELASVLNDLRATRTVLRKLPSRKAPRNFTLTRKMVSQNPPLPRAYPAFRLAALVATLLLFFSFGVNFLAMQTASPVQFGREGGGDVVESYAAEEPAPQAAAPVEEPTLLPALVQPPEETLRATETPARKDAGVDTVPAQEPPPAAEPLTRPQHQPLWIPSAWQMALAIVAAVSALLMVVMRHSAARRWK